LSKPIEEKLLIAKVSLLSKWHLEKSKADALESYINSGGSGKSPKEIYEEAGI
jgi:hypothetical protein